MYRGRQFNVLPGNLKWLRPNDGDGALYVIWKNNIDFIWAFAELVFSDC